MNENKRVLVIVFESETKESKVHCCKRMQREVEFVCPTCEYNLQCPDKTIYYSPVFDEYGIFIYDGSGTYELIEYCPWCGKKLPESRRDEWFDILEKMGYDDPLNQKIPDNFKTNGWYKSK